MSDGARCYVCCADALATQNRGYDSAGIVTVTNNGDFRVTKYASGVTTSDALDRLKVRDAVAMDVARVLFCAVC